MREQREQIKEHGGGREREKAVRALKGQNISESEVDLKKKKKKEY